MVKQGKTRPKIQERSPTLRISKLSVLKRQENNENAYALLYEVAKHVAPILYECNLKVGMLCEMYPKNSNLLGLNINRGQKILLRLRYSYNRNSFLPISDLIGTMLHELAHNLHGPHDARFYNYLNHLNSRFDSLGSGKLGSSIYFEEQKLGTSYSLSTKDLTIREKRLAILGKGKYRAEARRLGTSKDSPNSSFDTLPVNREDRRKLILEATERRIRDQKWCNNNPSDLEDVIPKQDDLEIIEFNNTPLNNTQESKQSHPTLSLVAREVIDLTRDDNLYMIEPEDEVIVIDACIEQNNSRDDDGLSSDCISKENSSKLLSQLDDGICKENETKDSELRLQSSDSRRLAPSADSGVQYISSSPGRTFFQDDVNDKYPRRKLVADLDFQDIIKKSNEFLLNDSVPVLYNEVTKPYHRGFLSMHTSVLKSSPHCRAKLLSEKLASINKTKRKRIAKSYSTIRQSESNR